MSDLSTMQGAALERTPQRIGEEIRSLTYQAKCMTVYFGVEIGRRLVEAKELVGHGGWGNFVQNETEFSQATASRFMKVFEAYGADQIGIFGAEAKSSTLQNLSISNALRLLAVPEEERENFALAVDADGVHVGQSDMEAGKVREKLGPDKIIGVSCKNVEQALLAKKHGADYLGVGAIYPTGTKKDADAVTPGMLAKICQAVDIPVVAIGGLNKEHLELLKGTGVDGIAVVSALFAADDIEKAAEELKEAVKKVL